MKCQEFLKFNMFLKYIDKDDTIMGYYDECMNCHDSLQCNKCNTIKEKTQFSNEVIHFFRMFLFVKILALTT